MMNALSLLSSYLGDEREGASRPLEVDTDTVAKALLELHGLALVVILLQEGGAPIPVQVSAPVVFLALTFVPGGLVVLRVHTDVRLRAKHVLYSLGVSLMSLMAIGFVLNVTLPLVGYDTPMARVPLAAAVTAFDVIVGASIFRRDVGGVISIPVLSLFSPIPLALLLLPLLSILGVGLLNRTGSNMVLVLVLVTVALVPLAVVTTRVSPTWHALGVWSMALAVLYHKALWKYSGYGGQPYGIWTWNAKRWTPGVINPDPSLSAELLPNGVLYPMYARLINVHIITQYVVINPVFVSFIPIALFVAFRRYTDSYKALLGASLFVFAHPFIMQYSSGGRTATPVLFLALFGVVISDRDSHRVVTSAFGMSFLLGVVVSHYGTSYYIMAALAGALVLLIFLRQIDDFVSKTDIRKLSPIELRALLTKSRAQLSLTLVLFYSVATLTWYMYMRGGRKFDLLPKHAKESYMQLIGGSTFSGRTAARLQKDYGTEAIQISKYLYLVIGFLIAGGMLVVFYRRLFKKRAAFDDHYFAIAVSLLGIFGTTVMVRNWGGGRPMMITYTFTTIFAVIGSAAVEGYILGKEHRAVHIFGVVLMALFLLNSGVASAVLIGGFAPSNVPNQDNIAESPAPRMQSTVYKETDIATHAWLIDHHEELGVYGDTFANRQKDWYRPEINFRTETSVDGYGEKVQDKPLELPTLARPGVENGYVILLGHNLGLNGVWDEQYGPPAASPDELELSDRDKVYTSGESAVYYYNESS